jgi:transcriptional regulator with XRE-family HTH domain
VSRSVGAAAGRSDARIVREHNTGRVPQLTRSLATPLGGSPVGRPKHTPIKLLAGPQSIKSPRRFDPLCIAAGARILQQTTRRSKQRGRAKSDGPNPIDVHVGSRVRLRRNMLGLSQEKLGEAIGLTFQQVQKYERGANRIGASRLLEIARVLDIPVTFFFDNVDPVRAPAIPQGSAGHALEADPLHVPETRELVGAFYDIQDAIVRRRLLDLAKTLVAQPGGDAALPESQHP